MAIWGLVTYAVERRMVEIAIRRALGATEGSLVRLMMRPSLWLLGIGAVTGTTAGAAAARVMHSNFDGLAPIDLTIVTPGAAVLTTVVVVAAWLPARRAARKTSGVVLRIT